MTDQSGRPAQEGADTNETTETKIPREVFGHVEDQAKSGTDLGEAIDRATAAVGQDDGKR
ncbi:hypothetical protein CIW48_12400 [Methylobacterium sp. P1-11]|uniref:hypothetical protein n=1 Tax=Methylobacterium sp. P1-11 TaxID=2024616 RepID=UPI0011EC5E63|nr:hypothetical protein [Methylobacterium sp. P1-11]KAA0123557.1 hypothetical protein CIW48_12400 [Methylobacterium sp. P1-11]